MTKDYLRYYDLESYLLDEVHQRFHREGKLDAFDFFSIIIWKANRSKSTLAHRLGKRPGGLEKAVAEFSRELFEAKSHEDRLRLTMEKWGFYLPMASAILTVLWPEEFTVYDVRVCDQLARANMGEFSGLANIGAKRIWPRYCEYCEAVKRAVPEHRKLRDKDRFLWGRSSALQLEKDIAAGFPKAT